MNRTLQPEDRIAHYRVVGQLGAGGMGEVYVARDETLERHVALKVLPAELVRNEERVRRFVTEAKSASSLSHPHIVAIYEIGQAPVETGDDDTGSDASAPVHYISMELIQGQTLQEKIHHERTDLRTLLGHLAQVAEGLAKAHALGIVHRDLKPSNIMISRDGYAKVLDFGLAKLTERTIADGDTTLAETAPADRTGAGVVLGTVGYMSPEQVRGQSVDHRSDIFSFGCLLYEAATGRRPFQADTDVETMHQILNQQPAPVEEVSPEVPSAVRRLIKRCLAKSPDRRATSMKDIAIELEAIVDEYDTLASSGSASSFATPPPATRRGLPVTAVLAIAALGIAGLAVGVWSLTRSKSPDDTSRPFQTMTMTSVLSAERIDSPVLSADGRYLAFVGGSPDGRELWVRQVATGSQVRIAGPEPDIGRVSFSPDGSYVFFRRRDPDTPNYSAIFSVPSLGGTPRKRLFDVDSPISMSPDGSRACFRRGVPQQGRNQLVIADLSDGTEVVRGETGDAFVITPPVWSPDGTSIAWTFSTPEGGIHTVLEIFPVEGGEPDRIRFPRGFVIDDIEWLPDAQHLVCAGGAVMSQRPQIWRIETETGDLTRITNDLNEYQALSVGEGGSTIAAIRITESSSLWTTPIDGASPARQLSFAGGGRLLPLSSLPNGDILGDWVREESSVVARVSPDGSNLRSLSPVDGHEWGAVAAGDAIVFRRIADDFTPHVWRMDFEGENRQQLTNGSGEFIVGRSPDGQTLLFRGEEGTVWSLPVEGGEPTHIADGLTDAGVVMFSPDSRFILTSALRPIGERWVRHYMVRPAEGGDPLYTIAPPRPGMLNVRWTPDGAGLSFQTPRQFDGENVYRIQLDGGDPRPLTRFTDGWIDWHFWSPDGQYLIIDRGHENGIGLWVQPFDGEHADGEAVELASFPSGYIANMVWLETRDTIAFRHATTARDLVLIRNFD